MRLIDAEPLYDKLEDYYKSSCGKAHEMARNCLDAVCDMPTVDAAPVKHGHWEDVGSLSCRCSECGCKNDRETMFCPNCGAKMDFLYDLRGKMDLEGLGDGKAD